MTLNFKRAAVWLPRALVESWRGLWRHDAGVYAAGIAFHSLTGVFAFTFLSTLILARLGGDASILQRLARYLADLVPEQVMEIVNTAQRVAERPVSAALLPVAFFVTIWMSSNVIGAIMHALNRSYHLRETRAFWRTRLFAMAFTLLGFIPVFLAFLLMASGPVVPILPDQWLEARAGILDALIQNKGVVSVTISFLAAFLVYWLAPNFKAGPRIVLPGVVFFTVSWLGASHVFNWYLTKIAVYDRIYGPVATVVVLLTWVNLSAWLLLFGGELNASYHRVVTGGDPKPPPVVPAKRV